MGGGIYLQRTGNACSGTEETKGKLGDLLGPLYGDNQFYQIVQFMTDRWGEGLVESEKAKPGTVRCLLLVYAGPNAISRIRTILGRMYRNDIRGLGGNDDCGQMSAWYVFSVMGFYPVAPGCDQYVLGAPYLPYMKVTLENGNAIEIKAPGVSDSRRYVRSVRLNGKPLSRLYLTHEELTKGCTLEFEMSERPNRKRGLSPADKPYSLTPTLL